MELENAAVLILSTADRIAGTDFATMYGTVWFTYRNSVLSLVPCSSFQDILYPAYITYSDYMSSML